MLRIQYLDKDRFMRQVAASKGSVYLRDPPRRTMPRSGPFVCFAVLQDAAADGLCHRQQFLLPDKAKLHLVLIRIADRQL